VQGAAKDTIEDGSGEREAKTGARCRLKQEMEDGRWKMEKKCHKKRNVYNIQ
jgi:hypothetical protein